MLKLAMALVRVSFEVGNDPGDPKIIIYPLQCFFVS
jgi:hypothetical protein